MEVIEPPRNYGDIHIAGQSHVLLGDQHVTHITSSNNSQKLSLLKALSYPSMNAKRAQLSLLSDPNLEWIWDEDDKSSFQSWLKAANCEKMFWISGRPASGKSTLVKYLSSGSQVGAMINKATEKSWLVIYFFFDFRGGDATANNLGGLLRTFLSQLIHRSNDIADFVAQDFVGEHLLTNPDLSTFDDLLGLLNRAAIAVNVNICAFVDGLDEYEGRYRDLISVLRYLQRAGWVLCIASRPEPELQQSFASYPGLRMQDFNLPTITKIIEASIEDIDHLPEIVTELTAEIEKHSSGVILWVCFASDELRAGLLNFDSPEALRKRLEGFPKTLEEVYARILARIPPLYEAEVALILQLVQNEASIPVKQLGKALRLFHTRGWLPRTSSGDLNIISVYMRIQALLGQLLVFNLDPSKYEEVLKSIRTGEMPESDFPYAIDFYILHKTLKTYLLQTRWVQNRLPQDFDREYPGHVWFRVLAEALVHLGDDVDLTISREMHLIFTGNSIFQDVCFSQESEHADSTPLYVLVGEVLATCAGQILPQRNRRFSSRSIPLLYERVRPINHKVLSFINDLDIVEELESMEGCSFRPPMRKFSFLSSYHSDIMPFKGLLEFVWLHRLMRWSRVEVEETDLPKPEPDHNVMWNVYEQLEGPPYRYLLESSDMLGTEYRVPAHLHPWYLTTILPRAKQQMEWFKVTKVLECSIEIEAQCYNNATMLTLLVDYGLPQVMFLEHNLLIDYRVQPLLSCTGINVNDLLFELRSNSGDRNGSLEGHEVVTNTSVPWRAVKLHRPVSIMYNVFSRQLSQSWRAPVRL